MALSWNEIKDRSLNFSKEWSDTKNEEADAKSFLDAFFDVFGVPRKKVALFEHKVKKLNDSDGYIDLLWKGTILIEMKSSGKDLKKAFEQAKNYALGLPSSELPKYILVCDFQNFRLFDTEEETTIEFKLSDFINNVVHFGFIAGYQKKIYKEQDPANIKAAELMGKFHDSLKAIGYEGHQLEVYLVRILFCLFAEDTTIFEKDLFQDYIEQRTNTDGSDLAPKINELFQILNTPKEKRYKNIDEGLNEFPYVNGKLFEEILANASFNNKMRNLLLECCHIDWSKISPAIFGSMFQSVMNPKERRNLGAHYTSEKNILKLIKPLFLDELWEEFESKKGNPNLLRDFQNKISKLKFLDPACGCGNFLVITYRELRFLELEILRVLYKTQQVTTIGEILLLDVDMMYGIEFEEFPARIAEVAMWLIDHQMNMHISNEFGQYFIRLPLRKSANIFHGNALHIDWNSILNSPKSPHENKLESSKSPLERGFRGVSLDSTDEDRFRGVSFPSTDEDRFRSVSLDSTEEDRFRSVSLETKTNKRIIIPYNPKLKEYARNLRNESTKSEIHFWSLVKGKVNNKFDFHRQKPLLNFIADFFCYELRLVIELDGITHIEPKTIEKDLIKENELNNIGLNILRFTDDAVLNHSDFVLNKLNEYINSFEKNDWYSFYDDFRYLNKLSKLNPEIVLQNGIHLTSIKSIDTPLNPSIDVISKSIDTPLNSSIDVISKSIDTPLNPGIDVISKSIDTRINSDNDIISKSIDTPLNPLTRGDLQEMRFDYIFGNPPFIGSKMMTENQRNDVKNLFNNISGSGVLDYVTAWYIKAAKYINSKSSKSPLENKLEFSKSFLENKLESSKSPLERGYRGVSLGYNESKTKAAFVSTNSIVQGEQVSILWNEMLNKYNIKIHFAHRTFKWGNEAKGNAAVYCVIIGFANFETNNKKIFEYEDIRGEAQETIVQNINPYLVNAKDILIDFNSNPICNVPNLIFGNMPNDNGNFLFNDEEKNNFLVLEPNAKNFILPFISAREFINNDKRFCLWLKDINASELLKLKEIYKRVVLVKEFREKSTREATRKLAKFPTLFGEDRQPKSTYILIPRHSSENRN